MKNPLIEGTVTGVYSAPREPAPCPWRYHLPTHITTREYIQRMMEPDGVVRSIVKQHQPGTKPRLVKTSMGWAVVNTPVAYGVQKYAKLWSQAWTWCRQQSEVNHG